MIRSPKRTPVVSSSNPRVQRAIAATLPLCLFRPAYLRQVTAHGDDDLPIRILPNSRIFFSTPRRRQEGKANWMSSGVTSDVMMEWMFWLRRLAVVILCLCVSETHCSTKCYKNEDLGEAEGNVYYCYGDEKPECCEQDSAFTCCETSTSKNLREQLQLWGTVAAFILVIGILFMCCKNDYSLCNDDKPLTQRLGLGRKPDPPLTDLNQEREREHTTEFNRNLYGSRTGNPYDRLPPLPPVTPFPDRESVGGRDSLYPSLDTPSPTVRGRSNSGFVDDEEYLYK
ncbi:hypothetical protein BaRGS_00035207 [Batillaria attramentaria]|uniref:Uncharacterized protein n=1 Tax=Batillaria attramentaria TaxID=370345 RepID=A0ABD0JF70_9CAEN